MYVENVILHVTKSLLQITTYWSPSILQGQIWLLLSILIMVSGVNQLFIAEVIPIYWLTAINILWYNIIGRCVCIWKLHFISFGLSSMELLVMWKHTENINALEFKLSCCGPITMGQIYRTGQFLNVLYGFQAESRKCYRVRKTLLQPRQGNQENSAHAFPTNPSLKKEHQSWSKSPSFPCKFRIRISEPIENTCEFFVYMLLFTIIFLI